MGLAPTPWVALLVMFFTGICNGFFNINLVTLFQLTTPTEMRGRVFSLLATVAQGLMPISMGLTGVVTDLLDQDIRLIFVATGTISLLIALAVSANREYRSYLAYQEPEGADDSASPPSATPGR
jgi:MFS family permease